MRQSGPGGGQWIGPRPPARRPPHEVLEERINSVIDLLEDLRSDVSELRRELVSGGHRVEEG